MSLETTTAILFFVYAFSELTDILDGFFARKYGIVSEFGKILDPMADSISRISFFLAFTTAPISVPLLFVLPLFYRDVLISALRILCGLSGFALAARWTGKFKAVFQSGVVCSILVLLAAFSQGYLFQETLHLAASTLTAIAALLSLASGLEYLLSHRALISRFLTQN